MRRVRTERSQGRHPRRSSHGVVVVRNVSRGESQDHAHQQLLTIGRRDAAVAIVTVIAVIGNTTVIATVVAGEMLTMTEEIGVVNEAIVAKRAVMAVIVVMFAIVVIVRAAIAVNTMMTMTAVSGEIDGTAHLDITVEVGLAIVTRPKSQPQPPPQQVPITRE